MIIAEQELKPCPHCGGKVTAKVHVTPDYVHGPAEYHQEIYCDNQECKDLYEDDIVAHWNTRAGDAELEELMKVKREHQRLLSLIETHIKGAKKIMKKYNYRPEVVSSNLSTITLLENFIYLSKE